MRVSMLMAYSTVASVYGDITEGINRAYAKKHGYKFNLIRLTKTEQEYGRPYSWMKIPAIYKILQEKQADWLMWIDADACVTNFDIKIEGLINDDYQQILSSDGALNCGVWLLKYSDYNCRFLGEVWNQEDLMNDSWLEQRAVIRLYKNDFMECRKKIQIIDKTLMNSYPADWKPGHFIYHMPAETTGARVEQFTKILNTIKT